MRAFKFYIGSKVGEVANNTDFAGETFSKETVVSIIGTVIKTYNCSPFDADIDGYTLHTVNGMWQGVPEDSYILEIMADDINVKMLAMQLKNFLLQDSIMVTVSEPSIIFF